MHKFFSENALKKRTFWVEEIRKLSGNFVEDFVKLEKELIFDIETNGIGSLIDQLRLCGSIPESYPHDSSEDKLYSKFTDALISQSFKAIGLKSLVLKERSDAADVEVFADNYNFIADGKAFRLSRTAKNQKDFKIQSMDGWKRGKDHAMVICPIYQLPNDSSQIYLQSTSKNVCIFTYSHLALILSYSSIDGIEKAQLLLSEIFKAVILLNPSKRASDYWLAIKRVIVSFSANIENLWSTQKEVALESIDIAKEEALIFLAKEREKIVKMS